MRNRGDGPKANVAGHGDPAKTIYVGKLGGCVARTCSRRSSCIGPVSARRRGSAFAFVEFRDAEAAEAAAAMDGTDIAGQRIARRGHAAKVGIVGAGAVGTYFGVRLAELGHDVRFLLNPGEAPPKALTVNSWQGDFELDAPTYASSPGELAAAGEAPTGSARTRSRVENPRRPSLGGFGRPAPDAVLHEGMATELRAAFVDDPAEIAAAQRL
ncbi:PanE/ApbA-like ketopantoate reductase [Aureococcus anophagefferens]|nr:PanE/ApbA-like ketopantoate reductase [Aureococcus anophagefferens]